MLGSTVSVAIHSRDVIGEGGFGVVYRAEQRDPIRRAVALKIIKLGMDTRQVVARFEAERQVLALMDHPNIAKVHDGGASDTGRPYFVMELVEGLPITQFCDQEPAIPNSRRLRLIDVGLSRSSPCSSEGNHPSRYQTIQRPCCQSRQRASSQDYRLWNCQGDATDVRPAHTALDAIPTTRRHARVYVTRAL